MLHFVVSEPYFVVVVVVVVVVVCYHGSFCT